MTDKYLKVEIITPQSVVFTGDAQSVNVPGSKSPFTVLINHAPIVSSLDNGIIKIKGIHNEIIYFAAGTGFVEVKDNVVSILIESAIPSSKLDRNKILAEIDLLNTEIETVTDKSEKEMLKVKLEFEKIKLKVTELESNI